MSRIATTTFAFLLGLSLLPSVQAQSTAPQPASPAASDTDQQAGEKKVVKFKADAELTPHTREQAAQPASPAHVQICPPYCGPANGTARELPVGPGAQINRPQPPKPIETRLAHPNAPGSEPGGIMGPAAPRPGLNPPAKAVAPAATSLLRSAAPSPGLNGANTTIGKCPKGSHWVQGPGDPHGHCELNPVPQD
ncbi:hypothetical protein [Thermomonas hydrothermalis]|uniref:Uncharacterized protein n=1 Tax=Thermomonas hydrothermalis TaxID=213588 RepID=A0A1M4ZSQ9_9GAMM|nr:hypothetical protein [Thermomonas hydrothermalis]SHF20837.1 hypothetical protein SAMN02745204_02022 [Thermomonas hydrothermalis]